MAGQACEPCHKKHLGCSLSGKPFFPRGGRSVAPAAPTFPSTRANPPPARSTSGPAGQAPLTVGQLERALAGFEMRLLGFLESRLDALEAAVEGLYEYEASESPDDSDMSVADSDIAAETTGLEEEEQEAAVVLLDEEEAAEVAADPDAGENEKDDASAVSETPSRGRA